MTQTITNTVSTFIDSQLPQFIREDNPAFGAFIKAYYQWMETSADSAIVSESKKLLSYIDVDKTTDAFIQYYINDFLPYFPNDVVLDERKLIKAAREFYQKKGSVESIQFLFRVLYNKEANIYFPKDQVLRASAGKWYLPQALRLVIADNPNFDISLLVGRQGLGAISNASCIIESATKTVDPGLGIELIELYVSNVQNEFNDLENLNIVYGYSMNGAPLVFSEKIIAAISDIKVDIHNQGLRYKGYSLDGAGNLLYIGDPVVISGGLPVGDPSARKAVAYVGNVTSGSITGATVQFGGYGYRQIPNTVVTVINDPSDTTGTGASLGVQTVDLANAISLTVANDSIWEHQSVILSDADYVFQNSHAHGYNANIATILGQAFYFNSLQFAPITSMKVLNGGAKYTAIPTVNLQVVYYSTYDDTLASISDFNGVNANLVYIDDLGLMCAANVVAGGQNYDNTKDVIVVPSAIGQNATFSFTTGAGGAITSVTVVTRGEGYIQLPTDLMVVNSANYQVAANGTGAHIVGYGFGQGANISLAVNQIGQVLDIRLTSRGFDYIATPNVSLRVADFVINPIGVNDFFVTDTIIYQGASLGAASWTAYVDSYDRANNLLRIYNYQGTLDVSKTLVATTVSTTINTTAPNFGVTIYGNGLAKAYAIFLNGLIDYPGFYLTTEGQLSADQYLQDSVTYHNYSYVVVVEKALRDYKQLLMQIAHPTGTSMLGQYTVKDQLVNNLIPSGNASVIPTINALSNITVNSFYHGTDPQIDIDYVFGANTNFNAQTYMIVFPANSSTQKIQIETDHGT